MRTKTPIGKAARALVGRLFAASLLMSGVAGAQEAAGPCCTVRQSMSDAWWTGPMLANSAATLPRGHFLIEPYFYDVTSKGSHGFGSRAYILYGLTDRLTVGYVPIVGFNKVRDGVNSSGVGMADLTLLAQYGLRQFREGSVLPALGLMVTETFPTGRFDRLDRMSDGFGGGANTTTVQLNSQTYFWLPNGRILRMRLDLSETLSNRATVEDASVYGTSDGFRGTAAPGNSFFADLAAEYSITKQWVLALDVTYGHGANTRVEGQMVDPADGRPLSSVLLNSGASDSFGYAPAIEYNFTPNLGVLVGARIITAGYRTSPSFTPAVAINFFH